MVDMKCEGCVNSVKNKLQSVNGMSWLQFLNTQSLTSMKWSFSCSSYSVVFCFPLWEKQLGVKNVEVDLVNQVVRILGSSPVNTMTEALEQTGRNARLIGQGIPEGWLTELSVLLYATLISPSVFFFICNFNIHIPSQAVCFSEVPQLHGEYSALYIFFEPDFQTRCLEHEGRFPWHIVASFICWK